MNRSAKILTLLLCFSLCAAGAIFSPKAQTQQSEPKTQIAPVINRQPPRAIWLRV
jgi:hypothetical protein